MTSRLLNISQLGVSRTCVSANIDSYIKLCLKICNNIFSIKTQGNKVYAEDMATSGLSVSTTCRHSAAGLFEYYSSIPVTHLLRS